MAAEAHRQFCAILKVYRLHQAATTLGASIRYTTEKHYAEKKVFIHRIKCGK